MIFNATKYTLTVDETAGGTVVDLPSHLIKKIKKIEKETDKETDKIGQEIADWINNEVNKIDKLDDYFVVVDLNKNLVNSILEKTNEKCVYPDFEKTVKKDDQEFITGFKGYRYHHNRKRAYYNDD